MPLRDKRISGTRSTSSARLKTQAAAADKSTSSTHASPMHAERLKNLYAAMLKCRALADVAPDGSDQGCCRGYEAIIAGAAIHLKPGDFLAPSIVEPFARFVQSLPVDPFAAGIKDNQKRVRNATLESAPAAAAMNIATGMALACKLQNNGLVTLCIAAGIGDGVSFGCEAIPFAASRKLPLVFVIGDDPNSRSKPADLRTDAQELLPVITVDGIDAVAVYRVAEECTRRARQGLGPSIIECQLDAGRDAIFFMENYLKQRDLWSEAWKQNLVRDCSRRARSVVDKYLGPGNARREVATTVR